MYIFHIITVYIIRHLILSAFVSLVQGKSFIYLMIARVNPNGRRTSPSMLTRTFVTCLEILHSLLLAIMRSRQRRTRHTRWCGYIPAGEGDGSRVERFPRRKLVCALPAVRHGNSECLNFDGIVATSWGALSNDEHIYRSLSLVLRASQSFILGSLTLPLLSSRYSLLIIRSQWMTAFLLFLKLRLNYFSF